MSKKPTQPGKYKQALLVALLVSFFFHGVFSSLLLKHYGCSTTFRVFDLLVIMSIIAFIISRSASKNLAIHLRKLLADKPMSWFVWVLLLFVAWCVIRAAQTNLSVMSLVIVILTDFSLFFAVLLGLSNMGSSKKNNALIVTSAIIGSVSILAVILYFAGLHDNLDKWLGYGLCGTNEVLKIGGDSGWLRTRGFVRNPNELGALLIVPIVVLLHAWVTDPRKRSGRLLVPLTGALSLLLLTFSRSSWLGLAIAIVALFIVDASFRLNVFRRALLIGFVLASLSIASFVIGRSNTLINSLFLHKGTQSNSTQQHIDAKEEGVDEIIDNPLGRGPATTGVVGLTINPTTYLESESSYLDIGVAYGWLGLILMIGLLIIVGLLLYQAAAWPVLAGFIGIAVAGMVIPVWSNLTVTLFTGLLVGLSLGKKTRN